MFDVIVSKSKKNKIQDKAVELLYLYRKILLSWATGCGKTLAALKMVKKYWETKDDIHGYIICKESNHLNNLQEDIELHGMDFIDSISDKFLYDSLHKYVRDDYVDFVILDECHAITEKRLSFLREIVGPNTLVIMLSATVDEIKSGLLTTLCGVYHEYHISIAKAIELGILPPPKVYVHYYELDYTDNNQIFTITRGIKSQREVINCNYEDISRYSGNKHIELNVTCTQRQAYELATDEVESYKNKWIATKKQWAYNLWVNSGTKRKRLMSSMKTKYAEDLLTSSFSGSRYICFTGSKIQAEKLGKYYVHSGRSNQANLNRKNAFNSRKINSLVVVNMFRESMNLEDIEKGLIVQLDNVKLSFVQMLGRVFRSVFPEMHMMVFKGTQDEKYLNTVMKDFDKKYVTIINH